MRNTIITTCVLFLLLWNGCVNSKQEKYFQGPATIIGKYETPIDAMRKIYLEFTELEKPVLEKIIFHKAKKKYEQIEFSWQLYTEPSYYEYILTKEANSFVSKHTGAEITATLMPIILHPKYGGEAAVILTAILTHTTNRKFEPSYHVAVLSNATSTFLHSTGYKSPNEKGKWNQKLSHEFQIGHWAYIGMKITPKYTKQTVPKNSLHYQLVELGRKNFYYTHAPKRLQVKPKIIDDANSVEDWLKKHPFSVQLDLTKHNEIVDEFGNDFTLLGLYPDEINDTFIYFNLNLKQYWPVIFGYIPQKKRSSRAKAKRESKKRWNQYKKEYASEFKREIFRLAEAHYKKR